VSLTCINMERYNRMLRLLNGYRLYLYTSRIERTPRTDGEAVACERWKKQAAIENQRERERERDFV